jgi:hypothetical protein
MMNKTNGKERRAEKRFQLQDSISLHGWHLPLIAEPTVKTRVVEGKVQNVSSGGLCLLAQTPLKVSEMVVGEIVVPGTQASIPTLLQVRWLRKNPRGKQYSAGLHYILQSGLAESLQTPASSPSPTTSKKQTGISAGQRK